MKHLFLIIRILAALFYGSLYYIGFDLFSCVLGFILVFAITTQPKQKKPEADTSSF